MGDLIEFTSQPHNKIIFHKFASNSLSFSVKSFGNANIGLAEKPDNTHLHHWVYIGRNGKTGIKEYDEIVAEVATPNIINRNGYKKFWLSWYDNKIQLGKYGESEAIVSKNVKTTNLEYVTFTVVDQQNAVDWKLVLPPSIERPTLKPIEGGKPYWVPYDGLIPYGAMIGGYENEFLYIIRAPHAGSLTPGKFVPSTGCGFVSWGGYMHLKTDFEMLCAYDCIWEPTKDDIIPAGAIQGGYTEHDGTEKMYVGRAECDGHVIPGKVPPSYSVCFFPYNDAEVAKSHFEILVAPFSSPRCNNRLPRNSSKFGSYPQNTESSSDDDNDDDDNHDENDDFGLG
ncbi:uncharacterized protein LOC119829614 [Zerene cesonia]|uniref:uncharacterized protein LOC119829614 n=1 Tax=Zerene cesonia TaxID=33412 RepID=UPI0018E5865A|nr:uncharacterized protein LOC119829614 [Zerene cesonia]